MQNGEEQNGKEYSQHFCSFEWVGMVCIDCEGSRGT